MKVNFTVFGSGKMTSMIGNLLSVSRCTGMENITCETIPPKFQYDWSQCPKFSRSMLSYTFAFSIYSIKQSMCA